MVLNGASSSQARFSLQWATVLVGLGHGLTVSLLSGVFMLLTIVLSSGPETRIFRSDYVARQLADSAEDRAALRAWAAGKQMPTPPPGASELLPPALGGTGPTALCELVHLKTNCNIPNS